jgi:small subunit ribosomal protein S9
MVSSVLHGLRRFPLTSQRPIAHAPFRRKRIQPIRPFVSSFRQRVEQQEDFKAAEGFDLDNPVFNHELPLLKRIRVVPKSPSHFSAKPRFNDTYLNVENLWLQTKTLPRVVEPEPQQWIAFEDMRRRVGKETVGKTRFEMMVEKLQNLSEIEPVLMPPEVKDVIGAHLKRQLIAEKKIKQDRVDEWGRSLAIGKRKTSIARAYLVMGDGEVLINSRNLVDYFNRLHDRESALWPLVITDRLHKYNVFGIVNGGGITGQAEAMTLAVAKALLIHEPELTQRLKDGKSDPSLIMSF